MPNTSGAGRRRDGFLTGCMGLIAEVATPGGRRTSARDPASGAAHAPAAVAVSSAGARSSTRPDRRRGSRRRRGISSGVGTTVVIGQSFAALLRNPRKWTEGPKAEGEGFEPSVQGLPTQRFSRPPDSTTLAPLRGRLGRDV